ncbi:tetratricopeptide repeat protein [Lichenihabitans psoromatis]|uniref:tetratricopeptide repeat protein n=1 Tax=Lichenihabitans psoromatis TaxID=2528642 RepID=UPI00103845B7|nr:tetratricopeptide repeat protein [Lichenihabitans psoromatis]
MSGRPFRPEDLRLWRLRLERRATALRKRGIPYVFLIAPDAHSIYPEDLPTSVAPFQPPGQIFFDAMQGIDNLTIVYPRRELMAAKGGLDLYKKNDTHWSSYGSFIAYREVCAAMRGLVDFNQIEFRDVEYRLTRDYGDLGALTSPEQPEQIGIPIFARQAASMQMFNQGPWRNNIQTYYSPGAPLSRALIFRDSFMTEQAAYFIRSFSETMLVGSTIRLYLDAVDLYRPDIVINETAERLLFSRETDHQIDGFVETYQTDYRSARGRDALEAMLHLGRGDASLALQIIANWPVDTSLDPDHAFLAARVCVANKEWQRGLAFVSQALAADRRSGAVLCVAAQVHLGLGHVDESSRLAAAASIRSPDNAHFHAMEAYIQIFMGRHVEARAILVRASRALPDDPHLSYLLSIAALASGDRVAARAALDDALNLDPGNPEFLQHDGVMKRSSGSESDRL